MKSLFPNIEPFNSGYLKVDELHEIYYEEVGNPDGYPILFLHGGPGAGIDENSRRFFDPNFYRVILFDQRGCGNSKPFAELRNNTTWNLIEDIEKIRRYLNIEKWVVFGGSWGSTLALIYAINHTERVLGLILRGIWLSREEEIAWTFRGGASRIFPEAWEKFESPINKTEKENIIEEYYRIFTEESSKDIKEYACKCWSQWEASISKLEISEDLINDFGELRKAIAIATIECHYFINNMFGQSDNYILENSESIKKLPTYIINGRYDIVCPIVSAYELYSNLENSKFEVANKSGHSASELEIIDGLIRATEEFKKYYQVN